VAVAPLVLRRARCAQNRGAEALPVGPARCYSALFNLFKYFQIDSIKRLPSRAQNFPNKILKCR
jgi:hypothetical protein